MERHPPGTMVTCRQKVTITTLKTGKKNNWKMQKSDAKFSDFGRFQGENYG